MTCCDVHTSQAAPGHKRAPSDASVASSEDDKVQPTPSALESVTEKTEVEHAEDRTSDKLSDEGLGTSEVDKTEEEKLNEVSDASNEDLGPALIEPTKDLISDDVTEPKPEAGQDEEIPAEPEPSQPEEPTDEVDTQELVTDGQETEEEQKETQEEKTEDEPAQVIEEERGQEEVKKEEEKEAGTEESGESQEQPEDVPEEPESIPVEVEQVEEESKEPDEEIPQHKETEDTADGTDLNADTENIESNVMDTNINGSVAESPAEVLLEKEAVEGQPEEKPEDVAPEEAEQPEQDNQPREEVEVKEVAPTESTNGVSDEAKDASDEQVVPCIDAPAKEDEEKATRADESTSQDAVSVPESETDSESKIEHGSPAVIKPDVEKDSDSGSSSAADSNSLDLNLSISSFLSKSKEGGSVSMQVTESVTHSPLLHYQHFF